MAEMSVEWVKKALGDREMAPFSVNAALLMDRALQECRARNHVLLGSEHVLWALFCSDWQEGGCPPRILHWVLERIGEDASTVARLTALRLEKRPLWAPMDPAQPTHGTNASPAGDDQSKGRNGALDESSAGPETVHLAKNFHNAMLLCMQFTGGPVHDPSLNVTHEAGLISTEAVVAGLLVEGKNAASSILQKLSKGRIKSSELLASIGVKVEELTLPPAESWDVRAIDISSKRETSEEWYPSDAPVEMEDLPMAPTATSNWLIPGKLLLGTKPGAYVRNSTKELKSYLNAGIRTFVCLIGEYRTTDAFMNAYPSQASRMKELNVGRVNFVHFRIDDMGVPSSSALTDFVLELARRLRCGENVFIHCYGGHGRTGIVAILLMCVLYDMSAHAARHYVQRSTFLHRKVDNESGFLHHMPESPVQHRLMEELAGSLDSL